MAACPAATVWVLWCDTPLSATEAAEYVPVLFLCGAPEIHPARIFKHSQSSLTSEHASGSSLRPPPHHRCCEYAALTAQHSPREVEMRGIVSAEGGRRWEQDWRRNIRRWAVSFPPKDGGQKIEQKIWQLQSERWGWEAGEHAGADKGSQGSLKRGPEAEDGWGRTDGRGQMFLMKLRKEGAGWASCRSLSALLYYSSTVKPSALILHRYAERSHVCAAVTSSTTFTHEQISSSRRVIGINERAAMFSKARQ